MNKIARFRRWLYLSGFIVFVILAIYWLHYQALMQMIPYPGGEAGEWSMASSWFIRGRAALYEQQTPIMALLATISIIACQFIWQRDDSRLGRGACIAVAWTGFWTLSTMALWFLAVFVSGLGVLASFFLLGVGAAQKRWQSALIAVMLTIIWTGYGLWYCGELFDVFGD